MSLLARSFNVSSTESAIHWRPHHAIDMHTVRNAYPISDGMPFSQQIKRSIVNMSTLTTDNHVRHGVSRKNVLLRNFTNTLVLLV